MARATRHRPSEAHDLAAADAVAGREWRKLARCAETDPEAFYPDDEGWSDQAKRVCAGCRVVAQCLAYVLVSGEPYGVWGGLTTAERIRVRYVVPARVL